MVLSVWEVIRPAKTMEPLYAEPYIVVYGRTSCGLTVKMSERLDAAGLPYLFKSIDDPLARDEVLSRMRAAGVYDRSFMLPVVDVNGHILLKAQMETIALYYEQP